MAILARKEAEDSGVISTRQQPHPCSQQQQQSSQPRSPCQHQHYQPIESPSNASQISCSGASTASALPVAEQLLLNLRDFGPSLWSQMTLGLSSVNPVEFNSLLAAAGQAYPPGSFCTSSSNGHSVHPLASSSYLGQQFVRPGTPNVQISSLPNSPISTSTPVLNDSGKAAADELSPSLSNNQQNCDNGKVPSSSSQEADHHPHEHSNCSQLLSLLLSNKGVMEVLLRKQSTDNDMIVNRLFELIENNRKRARQDDDEHNSDMVRDENDDDDDDNAKATLNEGNEGITTNNAKRQRTEGNEKLTTEGSEQPITEGSEQPITEGSEQPITERSEKPVTEGIEKPITEGNENPIIEGSENPIKEESEYFITEGSEKPIKEESENPITEGSEKPITEGSDKLITEKSVFR